MNLVSLIPKDKYNSSAIFYNNLITSHKEMQVFLELMDNHDAADITLQDIQDQLQECILWNYFH